jgi:hypothetical protein
MLELFGGVVIFLLGFWIWVRMLLVDLSNGSKMDSGDIIPFLMLVAPGFVVAVGCYLQSVHRKRWAFAVALIGLAGTLVFIGGNAQFAYAYAEDRFGLRVVWADLLALAITFVVVCVQTLRDNPVRTT